LVNLLKLIINIHIKNPLNGVFATQEWKFFRGLKIDYTYWSAKSKPTYRFS